jgi:hypothetical protein
LIGTAARAQTITIGNSTGGATRVGQNGGTLQLDGTNFDLSTAGVVTLAGGQAQDINTAVSGGAGAALVMQPGTSTGASSNGAATTIKGGDGSGTTNVTGGNLTLQAGSATGGAGTRNGGSVTLDAGFGGSAGTNGGTISIGTTNASGVTLGRGGVTTINGGSLTIQGGTVTAGTTSQQGSLVLHDGNGEKATISVGSALGADTALAIPTGVGATDTFCLLTLANCAGSGVTSIGTIDTPTTSADGAHISGTTLYLQTATALVPGLVSTGSQTFAGDKTFSGNLTVQGTTGLTLSGAGGDISFANGEKIDNDTNGQLNLSADSGAVTLLLTGTAANLNNSAGDLTVTSANALTLASANTANINVNPGTTGDVVFTQGNDSQHAINSTTTSDISLNVVDITSTNSAAASTGTLNLLAVRNLNEAGSATGTADSLIYATNLDANETVTNGILLEQATAGGTLSNAIQIVQSAGTLSNGILFGGTIGTDITTASGRDLTVLAGGAGIINLNDSVKIGTLGAATANSQAICRDTSTSSLTACDSGAGGLPFIQGGNTFGTAGTLGTNDNFDLNIERNNSTMLTVRTGDVQLASNIDLLLQGATAYISNSQGQTGSEAFGLNATVNASNQVALGNGASANGSDAIAIGAGAAAGNTQSIVIGSGAATGTGTRNIAIGHGAQAAANGIIGGLALGYQANAGNSYAIALGYGAASSTNGQLVIGSDADLQAANVTQVVIGSGVTDNDPSSFTLQGTSGSGSNIAGASVFIAGGQSTGNATGGSVVLQASAAGGSGSGTNSLSNLATFAATGLSIGNSSINTAVNIQSGTGNINLSTGSTGDVVVSQSSGSNLQVTALAAPSADQVVISNTGQASTTNGIDSVQVTFAASNASGDALHFAPSYAGGAANGLTYNVIEVDPFSPTNAAGADTVNGLLIGSLTDPGATINSTAINIGSGWDTAINASNGVILNIGNASTDFNSNGGLTLAENLTIQGTTGITLTGAGGDITFANGEKIDNDTDGQINLQANSGALTLLLTGTAASLTNSAGSLTIDSASGTLVLGSTTTILQKSATSFAFDLNNASDSTLTVTNAGAGVGSLSVEGDVNIGSGRQFKVNGTQISSSNLSNDSNLAKLSSNQTFTGTNTFQPTTDINSVTIKQTSAGSPTADIFDAQTANSTNILRITGPAANEAAVTLNSVGATRALTLTSQAAATWSTVSGTLTLQGGGGVVAKSADSSSANTGTVTLASGDQTGSSLSSGSLTIKSGDASGGTNSSSGNVSIDAGSKSGSGTTGSISLGATNASGLTIGSTSNFGSAVLKSNNNAAAFQVQNASSNEIFTVNASNNTVVLGKLGTGGINGKLVFNTATASNYTSTIAASGSQGANIDYVLPTAIATSGDCLKASSVSAPTVTLGFASCGGGGSGVTTVGTIDSQTKSADGAVIASTSIYMQTADATHPGLVSSSGSQTFAGNKTFTGQIIQNSDSSSAFILMDSTNTYNNLSFDSSNNHLRVYDHGSPRTAYLEMYYASGTGVVAASTGTTQIGNGTGDINLSLTNNSERFNFQHSGTNAGSTDIDFLVQRNLTGTTNNLQGAVMKVEDVSTFTSGSSAPDVLSINQNNTSATGNLIVARTGGGSNDKFKVSTAGTVTIASSQSYTGAGAVTLSAGASSALTLTGNAASTWSTTSGNITIQAAGTSSLNLDTGGAGTVNIANTNATTVAIASNATAHTINIGSTTGASALNLNAGTGNAVLNATSGTVTLQTTTSGAINLVPGGSSNVVLGTSDTTGTLLVLDTKTGSGDPTGVNGGMYYNSNTGRFRCYEAGAWKSCVGLAPTYLTSDQTQVNGGGTYTTLFTIPLTASKTNVIEAYLAQFSSATTVGIRNRARIDTAGQTGYCKFTNIATSTTTALDIIAVGTAPADTADTAAFAATNPFMNNIECTVSATGTPGNLVIEFTSETTGTVTTKAGSYYTIGVSQ